MAEISNFQVKASPHTSGKDTNRRIMLDVLIALLPTFIVGILFFGLYVIYTVLVCMLTCYIGEQLFNLACKKPLTKDLSCLVTGMILGLILPARISWYIPIVGGIVAIIFVKMIFGGIGKNFANPAATARVFLLLAFSVAMGKNIQPNIGDNFLNLDGQTAPTYLGGGFASLQYSYMGVSGYWGYILQLLFGHVGGSIGETSAIAIAIGAVYLIVRDVIDWRIPASYLISSVLMVFICYQSAYDVLPQILSGGLLFGAVFMATDYASSPKYKYNRVLYGIFLGFITIILRKFSNYPESVSFAIILANLFVPILDRYILPMRFGQTNKHGKVSVDVYAFSMRWVLPLFLVFIVILTAIYAVIRPYSERFYSTYIYNYSIAQEDNGDYFKKGDYLLNTKKNIEYLSSNDTMLKENLNATIVLFAENNVYKIRNILTISYGDTVDLQYTPYITDATTKSNPFNNKTLKEVQRLTENDLKVFLQGQSMAYNMTIKPLVEGKLDEKLTTINYALQDMTIESFRYVEFLQRDFVEYKVGYINVAVKDISTTISADLKYNIVLQKDRKGIWRVGSMMAANKASYEMAIDCAIFYDKTVEELQKLQISNEADKTVVLVTDRIKEQIVTFMNQKMRTTNSQQELTIKKVYCYA